MCNEIVYCMGYKTVAENEPIIQRCLESPCSMFIVTNVQIVFTPYPLHYTISLEMLIYSSLYLAVSWCHLATILTT